MVLNRADAALTHTFTTALPAGTYCDVYAGALDAGKCTGGSVTVDAGGMANVSVTPRSAVVIFAGGRL